MSILIKFPKESIFADKIRASVTEHTEGFQPEQTYQEKYGMPIGDSEEEIDTSGWNVLTDEKMETLCERKGFKFNPGENPI